MVDFYELKLTWCIMVSTSLRFILFELLPFKKKIIIAINYNKLLSQNNPHYNEFRLNNFRCICIFFVFYTSPEKRYYCFNESCIFL